MSRHDFVAFTTRFFEPIVRGLREDLASLRIRCALLLGTIGVALLLAVAAVGLHRQRSLESFAARLTPMDEGSGYYLVNSPLEPIVPASRSGWITPNRLAWLAVALLIAGGGGMAWYLNASRQRELVDPVQRYRRPRGNQPPARVVAKRKSIAALLAAEGGNERSGRLTVRQLMTESTVVAPPTASLQTVTSLLMSAPLRHVMICDPGGRLLGIITDRDLRHRRGRRAADVMTRDPVCVPPGALLGPAVTMMVDRQVSCLPVVDQGRVRGVLTSDDLALALDSLLQAHDKQLSTPSSAVDETVVLSSVETICADMRRPTVSEPTRGVAPVKLPS